MGGTWVPGGVTAGKMVDQAVSLPTPSRALTRNRTPAFCRPTLTLQVFAVIQPLLNPFGGTPG
jgi:hypothetical protein